MPKKKQQQRRVLDALPDTVDFRDRMYVPTLIEVPTTRPLDDYRGTQVPILDQGREGACTGFALATVANYLLRIRRVVRSDACVSPRMLYDIARRYDEWPGEDYEGSSARGAMKGWHKHGVCEDGKWPKDPQRWTDAALRPLGAYFRVNHRDLIAMHSAIAEVGILYATGMVHEGWDVVPATGRIRQREKMLGGHAFAVVAYDEDGFWIQNSWGEDWGRNGFALVSYDDWLANGTDVWVARLGAPVKLRSARATAISFTDAARGSRTYAFADLRPHVISIGNDGELRTGGTYGTSAEDVRSILAEDIPEVTGGWDEPHLLLYAHGGLVPEDSAIQRIADYRGALLANQVYPLSFIWKTDYWSTLRNILQDALRRRRPEGILDASKDFMLDRLDDALEPLARVLSGKSQWDEMKENAEAATTRARGGARIAADLLGKLIDPAMKLHVVGHSAGSIFHAYLVQYITSGRITAGPLRGRTGLGREIESCTLWAPACTLELFHRTYRPAIESGRIRRFTVFTLTDAAERDDHCGNIYHRSLLYLVANAFEARARIPLVRGGEPLLGMERFLREDAAFNALVKKGRIEWIRSPDTQQAGGQSASNATTHGGFDDDRPTVVATLARMLGRAPRPEQDITIHSSAAGQRARRETLVMAQEQP